MGQNGAGEGTRGWTGLRAYASEGVNSEGK